ncbi:hypothetical protein [Knoellia subterranea]|uniref:Uncharacterized protein n=1 Tax=Knoellia subterranea KCTC 19937 TaxID=1385521 RepID=A0A0A0JI88_9MICO|nr:hypothetical protein [Knoellia subterranea]KGN36838.1 hypothetical protein N803_17190 [Knoellia subterranea KCTC 19937]
MVLLTVPHSCVPLLGAAAIATRLRRTPRRRILGATAATPTAIGLATLQIGSTKDRLALVVEERRARLADPVG